jgi:hypothetical protein
MAVAFVRQGGTDTDGGTTGADLGSRTATLAVPAAGHAMGNTVVVAVTHQGSGGVVGIVDSKGNTYTKQKERSTGSLYVSLWTAYLSVALVSGDNITVTATSTAALDAASSEYSGVSSADPVDVDASNVGTGILIQCVLPAPSGADRVAVGAAGVVENADATDMTGTAGSGWTALIAPEYQFTGGQEWSLFNAYRALAAASVTFQYGLAGSGAVAATWAAVVFSLQSAPAGGTPAAPSSLVATTISASAIDLGWTDNAGDEVTFRVERSLDGITFAEIGSNAANDVTYSDTGLLAGTTYFYRVRARNATGDSAYTNIASATTTPSSTVTVPLAPANLSAVAIGSTRIQLDWTDASTDEDGFKIERSVDGTTYVQVAVVGGNVTSWVNSSLQPSTLYYYRLRSYNSAGNSGYCAPASATTFEDGAAGSGDCPVERYASVEDVQRLIWSSHLAISDMSEPNRASVEDWLCDVTQWIDRTLAWKWVVPVTDTGDREVLRPICAALVAARCWQALVARFPGQEDRAQELESEGLSRLVYNPGGAGSRLKGSVAVVVAHRTGVLGKSLIVLTGTAQASTELAGLRFASHTFTDPDSEDENATPRRFSLTKGL